MFYRPFKLISVVFVFLSSSIISAEEKADLNIHDICAQSPAACLENIEQFLTSVPIESRVWFNYKLYQLDALFNLVQVKSLKKELEKWIDSDDIPLKFKLTVYIYFAKLIQSEGDVELAEKYFNRAIDTLTSVNQENLNPMFVVQIANTLNYLGKYQQGYDMLKELEKQYMKRVDAILQLEIFENLGHFAVKLKKFDEHVYFRQKALYWAEQQKNIQRKAGAVFNLARSYQMMNDYPQAIIYFTQARKLALDVSDYYLAEITTFRYAEMALAQGNIKAAGEYFEQIDLSVLPKDNVMDKMIQELYEKINATNSIKK